MWAEIVVKHFTCNALKRDNRWFPGQGTVLAGQGSVRRAGMGGKGGQEWT